MKLLISLYFFIIAVVQLGILIGIYHYYQSQNKLKPSRYWLKSLSLNAIALTSFGIGILIIDDVSKPPFGFTVANTLFYASSVMQTLFCISLNKKIPKRIELFFIASIFAFIIFFEHLRNTNNFETRTIVMVSFVSIFYCWQIFEITKCRKNNDSKQLFYIQFVTILELLFALSRIAAILINESGIKQVEQLPQILILVTLAQLAMNTLSYIGVSSFWGEKISFQSALIVAKNIANEEKIEEITALLNEKEKLVFGLLKANKTATTGALTVSIAHEINQPLTATTLNLQLLKRLLDSKNVDIEKYKEIIGYLENDVKRASSTIKSLRSIFREDDELAEIIDVRSMLDDVLDIAKQALTENNIEAIIDIEENLTFKVFPNEIRQVLLNLLNNSIQALSNTNHSTKKIFIKAEKYNSIIQIILSDNGMGIDKEFQSNLFELLSTNKKTGLGLGLWLCKHIVTRHSGTIEYEDTANGAKFIIELPVAA